MQAQPTHCNVCGQALSADEDGRVCYNPACPVVIAEDDQIQAEVEEANTQPVEPGASEKVLEAARDALAYARFKRDLKGGR
jgi:hypothetical protein